VSLSGRAPYDLVEVGLFLPYWLAAVVSLIAAVVCFHYVRRRDVAPGSCPRCGYDLRATPERCPECGTTPGRRESSDSRSARPAIEKSVRRRENEGL